MPRSARAEIAPVPIPEEDESRTIDTRMNAGEEPLTHSETLVPPPEREAHPTFRLEGKEARVIGSMRTTSRTGQEGPRRQIVLVENERAVRYLSDNELDACLKAQPQIAKAFDRFDRTVGAVAAHVAEGTERETIIAALHERRDLIRVSADVQKDTAERLTNEARVVQAFAAITGKARDWYQQIGQAAGLSGERLETIIKILEQETPELIDDAKFLAEQKDLSPVEAMRLVTESAIASYNASGAGSIEAQATRMRREQHLSDAQDTVIDLRTQLEENEQRLQSLERGSNDWKTLAQEINRLDEKLTSACTDLTRSYHSLYPSIPREGVEGAIRELAGKEAVLGTELLNIQTRQELDERRAALRAERDMFQTALRNPREQFLQQGLTELFTAKDEVIGLVAEIWDTDERAAQELLKHTETDVFNSRDYMRLIFLWNNKTTEQRFLLTQRLRELAIHGQNNDTASRAFALVAERFLKDLREKQDFLNEAAERKFFKKPDEREKRLITRAADELGLDHADIEGIQERVELARTELREKIEEIRKENHPDDRATIAEAENLLWRIDYTLPDFLSAPLHTKKPGIFKRFTAFLNGTEAREIRGKEDLLQQLMNAESWIAWNVHATDEDFEERGERARSLADRRETPVRERRARRSTQAKKPSRSHRTGSKKQTTRRKNKATPESTS